MDMHCFYYILLLNSQRLRQHLSGLRAAVPWLLCCLLLSLGCSFYMIACSGYPGRVQMTGACRRVACPVLSCLVSPSLCCPVLVILCIICALFLSARVLRSCRRAACSEHIRIIFI